MSQPTESQQWIVDQLTKYANILPDPTLKPGFLAFVDKFAHAGWDPKLWEAITAEEGIVITADGITVNSFNYGGDPPFAIMTAMGKYIAFAPPNP